MELWHSELKKGQPGAWYLYIGEKRLDRHDDGVRHG